MDRANFNRLFGDIIKSCRAKASELEGFESGDGCIRVSYLPQNAWAASILETEDCGADRFEMTARITEEGNYVLNRGICTQAPVDSYAFSGMKVAACLKASELGLSERSGHDLNSLSHDEEHGFAACRGAVGYSLYYNHRIFALLIVAIVGASAAEDEKVADAAADVIQKWCAVNGFTCEVPEPILPR